jgi:hypothetical protein
MKVIHTGEKVEKGGIFLAGPSPRKPTKDTWRNRLIAKLEDTVFEGTLYSPEYRETNKKKFNYDDQVEWEWEALHAAKTIVFWVDRKFPDYPAFTTNVEFGLYIAKYPDRIVYGRPEDAVKTQYLDWLYTKVTGKTDIIKDFDVLVKKIVKL